MSDTSTAATAILPAGTYHIGDAGVALGWTAFQAVTETMGAERQIVVTGRNGIGGVFKAASGNADYYDVRTGWSFDAPTGRLGIVPVDMCIVANCAGMTGRYTFKEAVLLSITDGRMIVTDRTGRRLIDIDTNCDHVGAVVPTETLLAMAA